VIRALIPSRSNDTMGFSATLAHSSSAAASAIGGRHELILETYYKIQLTANLAFIPDAQVVHQPQGVSVTDDFVAFTPRLSFTF
jgi:carbohydrate-selective porin OprB